MSKKLVPLLFLTAVALVVFGFFATPTINPDDLHHEILKSQEETESRLDSGEEVEQERKGETISAKIGEGVVGTLKTNGEVLVVVSLIEPRSMKTSPIDLPTMRSEISDLQDQVLSELGPSDFSLRHKYQAIPALAGKVLSEIGLAKLVANSNVTRIDVDIGGGGN